MDGIVSVCIGKRGTGKTTFSKRMLELKPKDMPVVVYDVNNEYNEFYSEPFEDLNTFMNKIVELKGHYILIEEATIFFSPKGRVYEMVDLIVRARHTKNIIQLNFHSFSDFPNYIKNHIEYITIFKTNDNEKTVRDRIDKDYIVEAWLKIVQSKDKHEKITLRME